MSNYEISLVNDYLSTNGVTFIIKGQYEIVNGVITVWNIDGVAEPDLDTLKLSKAESTYNNLVALDELRFLRNRLLAETDLFMVSDFDITESKRNDYIAYRQQLRDLPDNNANIQSIDEVSFPVKPV